MEKFQSGSPDRWPEDVVFSKWPILYRIVAIPQKRKIMAGDAGVARALTMTDEASSHAFSAYIPGITSAPFRPERFGSGPRQRRDSAGPKAALTRSWPGRFLARSGMREPVHRPSRGGINDLT